jgi:S-formylglutathione hydrolase FrmB
MPAVERGYHVSRNREDTAIAGLSMGGAETLYTALNHLDRFAWMASFSGAFVMWPRLVEPTATAATTATAAPSATVASPPAAPSGPGAGGRAAARRLDGAVLEKVFPALDANVNSRIRMLWGSHSDRGVHAADEDSDRDLLRRQHP